MPRRAWVAAAIATLLLGLLVIAQLVLPGLAANRIEGRLTAGGGEASATVSSFPAARLLFGDGDRVSINGEGLHLPLDSDTDAFARLDGFGEVEVELANFQAGPFTVSRFDLTRRGSEPYHLVTSSSTTAAELVGYGADRLGIPGSSLLEFLAGRTGAGDRTIPIRLDMGLASDDGRIRVVSGGGTVAGYPAGPLAELLTAAIVVRI
jgi:hypothetical protein